ncbi:hypothetical protein ACLOJK_012258 [Asimina triloba]
MGDRSKKKDDDDETDTKIDFSGGNVHVVTSKENWDEKIDEANKDGKIVHSSFPAEVLINFSASWCGPCRMIVPTYSDLSVKYSSLVFLMVDVDELLEFSSSWDIRATPTFFFLRNGQQVDKLVGANKPELEKKELEHESKTFDFLTKLLSIDVPFTANSGPISPNSQDADTASLCSGGSASAVGVGRGGQHVTVLASSL